MRPFFQGKVDTFCALYAVLNGLKVTHRIKTLHARDIFHETLMGLAQNPNIFRAVLEQRTDYIAIVDTMLNIQCQKMPLYVEKPFENCKTTPSPAEVWNTIEQWLVPDLQKRHRDENGFVLNRAVIFRFLRYLMPDSDPINRHWTTAFRMDEEKGLLFFDCSLEPNAVYNITPEAFVTDPKKINSQQLCCIEPNSIRFMSPKMRRSAKA